MELSIAQTCYSSYCKSWQ